MGHLREQSALNFPVLIESLYMKLQFVSYIYCCIVLRVMGVCGSVVVSGVRFEGSGVRRNKITRTAERGTRQYSSG